MMMINIIMIKQYRHGEEKGDFVDNNGDVCDDDDYCLLLF